ncbi:MAG: hypothetical protein KDB27_17915 [Planctomycetales bacterium]|nr:hypothetical protein [Planctomycetales bacterium]
MRPKPEDDVDQLLLNAQLRDELEPFLDESLEVINTRVMPTSMENEYLASMLEWERAPVLPISRWFRPELRLPRPDDLNDEQLTEVLWDTINKLYQKRIVLEFTEHLSDYELYCLIFRDILPSLEKKIARRNTFLHWQCIDDVGSADIWLRYYATADERAMWAEETGRLLPASEPPPFPRRMPRRPI